MNHLAEPQHAPPSIAIILKSLVKKREKATISHWSIGNLCLCESWTSCRLLHRWMVLRQENREKEAATEGRWVPTLWRALGTMEPGALPTTQPSLEHSKDGAHSGLEELSNAPWSPHLLGLEFPAPSLLLHSHTSHILQHPERGALTGNGVSLSY